MLQSRLLNYSFMSRLPIVNLIIPARWTHTLPPEMALQKAGRLCLDLGKVKSLLFLLLEKPHLDTNTLHPYLEEALPHYKVLQLILLSIFEIEYSSIIQIMVVSLS
jgi:hypothetical protein